MGILRIDDSQRIEIEEFRRMLVSCAGMNRGKNKEPAEKIEDPEDNVVCVTCGVSSLGIAIVKQLLLHGYFVRVIVDSEEDVDKLREMQISGEVRGTKVIEAVTAKLSEAESLSQAFNGCCGVFHTAAFVDPEGLSGYTKSKVEIEVKTTRNVIEVCAATASVRYCVLASSLMTCIWHDRSGGDASHIIIDHHCWSDESVCINKKLWYALGKLRAEKAATELAKEMDLKLATICSGLIIGPQSYSRNSTPTIAYLKGSREMYAEGLLAVVDVNNVAKAHLCVFEELKRNATGRYICFDRIVQRQEELEKLSQETSLDFSFLYDVSMNSPARFELSNLKLSRLMSRRLGCNV